MRQNSCESWDKFIAAALQSHAVMNFCFGVFYFSSFRFPLFLSLSLRFVLLFFSRLILFCASVRFRMHCIDTNVLTYKTTEALEKVDFDFDGKMCAAMVVRYSYRIFGARFRACIPEKIYIHHWNIERWTGTIGLVNVRYTKLIGPPRRVYHTTRCFLCPCSALQIRLFVNFV